MTFRSAYLSTACLVLFSVSSAHGAQSDQQPNTAFEQGVNISHWLAQHHEGKYATPERFSASDAKWIAKHGFDHVRIPVDGRILMSIEGKLIEELLEPFDQALEWCEQNNLGVILDMHYLPGNEFLNDPEDNALWTDPELRETAAALWVAIAEKYKDVGPRLRFELLNEAVAPENEDLNVLSRLLVERIRQVDTDRVLYVSSNKWGQFQTVPDVHVFDDPNVHYAFHIYEPFLFTHQSAPWTDLKDLEPGSVTYPGAYEAPEGTSVAEALEEDGVVYDEAYLEGLFEPVAEWAKKHNAQVVITEFGVYRVADSQSTQNWVRDIVEECEEAGFGWTIWDYKGGFAVRGPDGKPTAVYKGLFPKK